MELHHVDQTGNGGITELTVTDDRLNGNFKRNHSNTGQDASKIDRVEWKKIRRQYWSEQ